MIRCPLCDSENVFALPGLPVRPFFRCRICQLYFLHPDERLSPAEELAHYRLHRNSFSDPAYRAFLGRLFHPVAARIPPGAKGLDFGCGPAPVLSSMFDEAGCVMANFDPFFCPDATVWSDAYDFITACETVEHLSAPGRELERLFRRLRPGGILGIMTRFAPELAAFPDWFYKDDPTHVCCFSMETFEFLARQWHAELFLCHCQVAILTKSDKERFT